MFILSAGFDLAGGQKKPASISYLCASGDALDRGAGSVCDLRRNCADGSDEGHCVLGGRFDGCFGQTGKPVSIVR